MIIYRMHHHPFTALEFYEIQPVKGAATSTSVFVYVYTMQGEGEKLRPLIIRRHIHVQNSGSGGSCSLGSISTPSLLSGQNVFLNKPVESYFFLSATRRSQFSPKEAATRAGGSLRPRNCPS